MPSQVVPRAARPKPLPVLTPQAEADKIADRAAAAARVAQRRAGAKWEKPDMVTMGRAEAVARRLFPDEAFSGEDCRNEVGLVGEPCAICAGRWADWRRRVLQTRAALLEAF